MNHVYFGVRALFEILNLKLGIHRSGLGQTRKHCLFYTCKNTKVVTNMQTDCNKSIPKLLTSCVRTVCCKLLEQVWNKLLTTRNKLDGTIRLVTRLFQQD